ncbi:sodium-coupled monocarboxylate transporter 1-like [Rhopilema esculentum]|uniref:sodium-coupled monocarboxylate transporter 1-like n=1 Tax=Rhopilema esculentum TaxID=499914 RepID=UPI0031E373AE|eukprot:gene11630-21871_t
MASSLSAVDYIVFVLMLVLSSAIGIYYGIKGKQKSTKEYLTASGSMHWLPISISMLATFVSAIALMGIPSEVYTYGIQYLITVLSFVIMLSVGALVYAPIFYKTQVTSANEYLEKRFSYGIRLVGCIMFILQYVLYLAVVIYAPSLALQAVAGVPLAASIVSTGVVCTFYTTLGGMRGVVWTDVFQTFVMLLGVIVIIAIGTNEVGGIKNVIDIARDGERLKLFDFNPDPTVRNTFWTLFIGATFSFISTWTTSQVVVQRFLSASSLKNVKKALFTNILFFLVTYSVCCFSGLVMYAVYSKCDPRSVKEIKSNDQIIPYFVIHKLSHLKGVPGLYTACLFSGALSSASSGLNSLTAVVVEDIIKRRHPTLTDEKAMHVSKLIACAFGVLVISLSFLVSVVGTQVLQLAYSIAGIIGSPSFGMFTLGMLSKRANSKGAFCGVIFGVTMSAWISLGGILFPGDKAPAPVQVTNCSALGIYNATNFPNTVDGKVIYNFKPHDFPLAKLYSLSHYWYGTIGIFSTIIIGWLVSIVTGRHDEKESVDPKLLFDFQSILPARFLSSPNSFDVVQSSSSLELKEA